MGRVVITAPADLVLRLALWAIPPGPVRERYRSEVRSELWDLAPWAQVRVAASFLRGAPRLRLVLDRAGVLPFPHSPTWCRLRLHHRWHTTSTDDGARYRRCDRCGLDDDGTTGASAHTGSLAMGGFYKPS